MTIMDPSRLDLNLLRVLLALQEERHVTRAAARLGLTQSAVSNALRRLRATFQDELFLRTPQGMEPTALACELAAPIAAALDAVQAALVQNRPFAPDTATEHFTIGASDYAEFVLAPRLVSALQREAPGVSVVFRHVDRDVAAALLDEDRVHLAIGTLSEPPVRMTRTMLMRDGYAVMMRRDHPAARALDLETYLAWPHLLVSPVASATGAVDRALAALGRRRRLAVIVSHYLVVAPMLAGSDLICTLTQRLAHPLAAGFGLAVRPLPAGLTLAPQPTSLMFHNRHAQRPAHRWLRRLVRDTARGLP